MAPPAAVDPLKRPPGTAEGEGSQGGAKKPRRECHEFEPRRFLEIIKNRSTALMFS